MRLRWLLAAAAVCGYRILRGVGSFSRFRLGNAVVGERSKVISLLRALQSSSNEAEVGLKKQHHHPYKHLRPVTRQSSAYKLITPETIQRVNSKAKLTELFKDRLSQGGVSFSVGGRALCHCPFHDDRTPSCSIDDNLGVYHCFGCGASGNAIKFIMEADGLSFRNAVEQLASEIGVDVEYTRTTTTSGNATASSNAAAIREQEQVDSIYFALEMAALFYARCLSLLPQGGKARSYLSERGVSANTTAHFLLGLSPIHMESSSSSTSLSRRSPLVAHLQDECGLDEKTLVLAGLVSSKNVYQDRMHGRLVIPIRDHRGAVIGFGGRYVDEVIGRKQKEFEKKEDHHFPKSPKYLNSPQTKLFKKSRIVFGLDRAKKAINLNDCCIVVEGYFDVIALHEKGIQHAVASMGCSLTEEQLHLVSRFTPSKRIIICPDDDRAGYMAIEHLCCIDPGRGRSCFADLTEVGIDIRVALLPDMSSRSNVKWEEDAGDAAQWVEQQSKSKRGGLEVTDDNDPVPEVFSIKDPCDFVTTYGAKVFEEQVVKKAIPWTDWYANRILAKHTGWESDSGICRNCVSGLTTFFSLLPSLTDRTMHIYRYASVLSRGSNGARIQLESDLLSEVVRKERKRNALRNRVENLNSGGIGIVSNSSIERQQLSRSTSSHVVNSKSRAGGVHRAMTRPPPSDSVVLNKLSRGEATGYNVKPVDDKAASIEEVGDQQQQHFTWEDVLRAASKAAELAASGQQTRRGGGGMNRSWQRKHQRKSTAKGSSMRAGRVGRWGTWDTNDEWLPYEDNNFYQHEVALASAELAILRLMICDASRRCELVTNLKDADIHFTAPERQHLFDVIATLPTEMKDLEGLNLSSYLENCIVSASESKAAAADVSAILRSTLLDEENATHDQCCSGSGEQELQEAQLVLFRARAALMVSSLAQELYKVQKSIATIMATGKELHEGQLRALEANRSVAFEKLHEVCVSATKKNLADFFLLVDLLE